MQTDVPRATVRTTPLAPSWPRQLRVLLLGCCLLIAPPEFSSLFRGVPLVGGLGRSATVSAAEPQPPPNIVLIYADDLGYGDVAGFGGRDTATPSLRRLAEEGTRFTSFCVSQPVCTASRASLLTGCYANRVGLAGALNHTSRTGIHRDERLLSELLQRRGYATALFGKWHLGHQPAFLPTRRGFDEFFGIPYSNDNGPLHPTIRGIPSLPLMEAERVIALDPDQSQFTRWLTERSQQFIERHATRPFFLYLAHIMPHVPIAATAAAQGRTGQGLYADVVAELDRGIGAVLATLERLKLTDQTWIIFASDNGPFLSYGDHAGSARPFREGKLTTFEGGVRVPCVMRWPGQIPAGRECRGLITNLDLLPTIVAQVGAAAPERPIDGLNLWPMIQGSVADGPERVMAYYSGDELQAIRQGRWKLHFPHDYLTVDGPPGTGGKPANFARMQPRAIEESGIRGIASRHGYRVAQIEQSLFDLETDPGETRNCAAEQPAIVAALAQHAERLRQDLGDRLTGRTGTGVRAAGRD